MKRFGNIFPKIVDMDNLRLAHHNASRGKQYYKEVKMVNDNPDYYLKQIQEMLINGTYEVSPYEQEIINDKGKERELMKLPYFPDRIIQWAIMQQIEPIFMKTFCYHTCASINGRGGNHAYKLIRKYLKDVEGTKYCLKLDVKKFYPSINKDILKIQLRRKFKDECLLELLDKIVDSYPKEKGVPIGSYLSQFLANFYLSYFDHWLKEDLEIKYVVRYMDDIVILYKNKTKLHYILNDIRDWLFYVLDLKLKPNYQIFPVESRGVDFVGYRFFHHFILLRKRTCNRFKRVTINIKRKIEEGLKTSYSDLCSINSYLGWIKYCDSYRLCEKYINPISCVLKEG